jgi:uroporphyrinogen decarboxylase
MEMTMDHKERVWRTARRQPVDRVPLSTYGTPPNVLTRLYCELSCRSERAMYDRLGLDFYSTWGVMRYAGPPKMWRGAPANAWGIPSDSQAAGYEGKNCPLAEATSVDEIDAHPWPAPEEFEFNVLREAYAAWPDRAIIADLNAPILHQLAHLCGYETGMANLAAQPHVAEAILRHLSGFWVAATHRLFEIGGGRTDIVVFCNDFGTQRAPLISLAVFRRFFRPCLQKLYDVVHEHGALVMQHSCGSVAPFLADFVDMGADILNPLQVSAAGMDLARLASQYRGRVAFMGGIDTQWLLPEGPEGRIRAAVTAAIDLFGPDGGYMLAGSQGLLEDIPTRHVVAMFDEGRMYRPWDRAAATQHDKGVTQ